MHPFLDWCHGHVDKIGQFLHLTVEKELRLSQPIYDDMVPADVSVMPYIVNYRNRRHIFIYNTEVTAVTLSDNAGEWTLTLQPQTWTFLGAPQGTQLKATTGTGVVIRVLCTDEILPITLPAQLAVVPLSATTTFGIDRNVATLLTNSTTAATFTSADIAVGPYTELAVDIVFGGFTGGTAPTITYTIKRKDAFNNYLTIYQSAALSAAGNLILSIGSGMGVGTLATNNTGIGVSFGNVIQISYTTTGAPTSLTQSITVRGK